MLTRSNPQEAERLLELAQQDVNERWKLYERWMAGGAGAMPIREGKGM